MADLTKLSGPRLNALIAHLDLIDAKSIKTLIHAGMGSFTGAQVRAKAKQPCDFPDVRLCREHVANQDELNAARAELEARRRYHGGDKPIRRRA